MDLQPSIFSAVFAIAAAITGGLAWYVWHRRGSPGRRYFVLFLLAAAEWSLASALENSVADVPSKILFARLAYVGVSTIAPFWLLFTLDYSRQKQWLQSRWLPLIWTVPAATLALALTNDWHGLIWTDIVPASDQPGAILVYVLGPASLVHAAFAYVLLLSGSAILLQAELRSSRGSYLPVLTVLAGILISLLANLLYPTSLNPFAGLDITPIAFAISGLLFTWAIFRQRFFELLPVAREMLIQVMSDGAIVIDGNGRVVEINPAAELMLGLPDDYVHGYEERASILWPALARCFDSDTGAEEEIMIDGKDGAVWLETRVSVLRDDRGRGGGRLVVLRDITKRKHAEDELRRSNETLTAALHEKEVLLKEIHHRVKNNLQVVSSILSLQSGSAGSESQATLLRESQDRIRSMALVHEKLYRSRDLSRINFAEYVQSLVASLVHSYTAGTSVRTRVDIPEVYLDIDKAIPCGLIINELVSNSLKYAFRDGRAGEICVSMARDGSRYTLTVSDDGPGLPPGFDHRKATTLGLQLVHSLVDQLEGTIEYNAEKGTRYMITFAEKE